MKRRSSRERPSGRARRTSRRSARRRGIGLRLLVVFVWSSLFLVGVTLVLTIPFRWIDPPTSSIMLQRRLGLGGASAVRPRYVWSDWNEISPHLAASVIAAEDQKFPDHFGFDFESIADALEGPERNRRGASTISQQVVKNLYLWPGRNLVRKGLEAYLTLAIETLWPKRRILEIYLNIAEFGPDVFGAAAASELHFQKLPGRLSAREAALMAAVLPNPARFSASRPSAYVVQRADRIGSEAHRLRIRGALRGL